jgi:predicted regulator of Ras-like GTPase activity (Roadblock/LC7/MglB family)
MIHYFTNKEGNMDRYSQILQELIKNTGLEGASLVSADGLPISSVLKPGMEEDRIAAMSAAILSLGERVSEELAKGTLEQITIKGRDGYVILTGVGTDAGDGGPGRQQCQAGSSSYGDQKGSREAQDTPLN